MKKNKRLLILVGILLVFGGFTFAYFAGRMLTDGSGATTTVTTASIKSSTVTVTGTLNFDYNGMLPGHKDVSAITVTATGNNELIPYNLVWKGSNNLNTDLKFTVYKVSETVSVESKCEKIKKNVSGGQMLYEECEISNITSLGEAISEGTIPKNSTGTTVTLAPNEFITSTSTGAKAYYYVVLEYPNLDGSQNLDMGQGFEGEVTVEPSNIEPDINILAVNVYNKKTGKYEEQKDIPQEGYTIDEEKSKCSNGAKPSWDIKNNGLLVTSLNQSGTECYLYFDIFESDKTLVKLKIEEVNGEIEEFTGPSCDSSSDNCGANEATNMKQNGIYEAEDDFGTSYYYRGTIDNNWVIFGRDNNDNYIWWRIIRINGNGTIRIMYAGTSDNVKNAPAPTGDTTMIKPKTSINSGNEVNAIYFNEKYNDNKHVGYMYPGNTESSSTNFDGAHKVDKNSTKSDALTQIEQWYKQDTNLGELAEKYIDVNTGFCSDSTVSKINHGSVFTGKGYETQRTTYIGQDRVIQSNNSGVANPQNPTLKCGYDVINSTLNKEDQKRDLYTGPNATSGGTKGSNGEYIEGNNALPIPVGLITMDETIYAGGFYQKGNANYWLKTDKYYWTMTPYAFNNGAVVFSVQNDGSLTSNNTSYNNRGARPVINLKSTVKITTNGEGDPGTTTNPYIVVTE